MAVIVLRDSLFVLREGGPQSHEAALLHENFSLQRLLFRDYRECQGHRGCREGIAADGAMNLQGPTRARGQTFLS